MALYRVSVGGGAVGNAAVGDVLSGKTFSSETAGSDATGTMANYGSKTVEGGKVTSDNTKTYVNVKSAGYYDTSSKLSVLNSDLASASLHFDLQTDASLDWSPGTDATGETYIRNIDISNFKTIKVSNFSCIRISASGQVSSKHSKDTISIYLDDGSPITLTSGSYNISGHKTLEILMRAFAPADNSYYYKRVSATIDIS